MIKFSSFSYGILYPSIHSTHHKTPFVTCYYSKVYFNAKFLLKQSSKKFLIEKKIFQLFYKLHNRNVTLKKRGCLVSKFFWQGLAHIIFFLSELLFCWIKKYVTSQFLVRFGCVQVYMFILFFYIYFKDKSVKLKEGWFFF